MTPETFIVEFWRSIGQYPCPRVIIAAGFNVDEAAKMCASLRRRGYDVQVYKLEKVETPKLKTG